MNISKTTVEIDTDKLDTVMRMGGFATRKEAIDWALTEAERLARINRIADEPMDAEMLRDAIDPNYDILKIRRAPVKYNVPRK